MALKLVKRKSKLSNKKKMKFEMKNAGGKKDLKIELFPGKFSLGPRREFPFGFLNWICDLRNYQYGCLIPIWATF